MRDYGCVFVIDHCGLHHSELTLRQIHMFTAKTVSKHYTLLISFAVYKGQFIASTYLSSVKFDILNPTEKNFHYFWHRLSESVSEKEFPFHCDTVSGWLASGHKTTASFSFLSEEVGIFESFWYFCVPELETEIPFLLVGTVTEPCVHFANTNLQFDSTFTSVKTSVTTHLVNCETVPIMFKFDSYSLYCDQNLEHVIVKPMCGQILPDSDLLISIEYIPTIAGTMNFRLVCTVSFLKNPLYLTVSGTVYNIYPIITCRSSSQTSTVLSMNDVNVIDIEEVSITYVK
ncbi:hydrocephalus-inducing protein homolog [Schistocerca americana]|uniref:hydrocephalus-inducing protein homolog n=1 Tax=Schistocerca americana TaxID=7009 RepID=UPI001F4F9D17|nr:hydrocephalus-inducing protein homolog [Schistocerca americana]